MLTKQVQTVVLYTVCTLTTRRSNAAGYPAAQGEYMEPIHVVGAVFIAYIVVKEVFVLVKGETKQIAKDMAALREELLTKGENNKSPSEQIEELYHTFPHMYEQLKRAADQADDLHKWHDKEDEDGVKLWYRKRSVDNHMKEIVDVLEKQRELMSRTLDISDGLNKEIKRLRELAEMCGVVTDDKQE